MKKKGLALLLAIALLLTGCASYQESKEKQDTGTGENETASFLPNGQVYVAEWGGSFQYGDLFWPYRLVLGDHVLYYAEVFPEDESKEFRTELYQWKDGEKAESFYTIEDAYGYHLLQDGQGDLYCLYSDRSEKSIEEKPIRLLKLSPDGRLIYDEPVIGEEGEDGGKAVTAHLTDALVTEEGRVCACDSDGTIYFWDEEGKLIRTAEAPKKEIERFSDYGLVNAGENGCYWYTWDGGTLTCYTLSPKDGSIGDGISLFRENIYQAVYDGGTGILIQDQSSLSLYIPGQGEQVKMLQWNSRDIGINSDEIKAIAIEESGELTCLSSGRNGDGYLHQWVSLKPGEETPEGDCTIRLGMISSLTADVEADNMKILLNEFHRLYPDYTVEIVTYDMSRMEFVLDLLKENGPDIIDVSFMDVDMLTDKGILEDMTPYLAASEVVGEEDLLPSVLRAMTVNGKIVRVLDQITIWGNVVAAGTTDGGAWTPEEYLALADRQTPGVYISGFMSSRELFAVAMERGLYSFVDWENRTCHFTDERFIELLEKAAEIGVESTGLEDQGQWKSYHSGQVLMMKAVWLYGVRGLLEMQEAFGEESEFVGYPNYDGTPQYTMYGNYTFGINSASDKKDIAWKLLELILSKDYQEKCRQSEMLSWRYLPAREDVLARECDGAYGLPPGVPVVEKNSYSGEEHSYPNGIPAMTEEEKEELRFVLDNAYVGSPISGVIFEIMQEEVQAYFAGDKTAAEVAEVIQNRVSLYLNE